MSHSAERWMRWHVPSFDPFKLSIAAQAAGDRVPRGRFGHRESWRNQEGNVQSHHGRHLPAAPCLICPHGSVQEVYTSVATAMHKVAALYGKPADVQVGPLPKWRQTYTSVVSGGRMVCYWRGSRGSVKPSSSTGEGCFEDLVLAQYPVPSLCRTDARNLHTCLSSLRQLAAIKFGSRDVLRAHLNRSEV